MNVRPALNLLRRARVYHLQPGDIVVLESENRVSEAEAARMIDAAGDVFAPAKVVLLEGGVKVRVLRTKQAAD